MESWVLLAVSVCAFIVATSADHHNGGYHAPAKCEDRASKAYCRYGVRSNWCTTRPNTMMVECKKSCGWCEDVTTTTAVPATTPTTPTKCENRASDRDCRRWVWKNWCITRPKTMMVKCKKSCGWCQDVTTTTAVPDATTNTTTTKGTTRHGAGTDATKVSPSPHCPIYECIRDHMNCEIEYFTNSMGCEECRCKDPTPRPIDPIPPDTLWRVNVTTMRCPISTQDHCQHPGTTGKVWIKIRGSRKNTDWLELKPKNGEFEEGFTDEFHFKTPNIGGQRGVYIEHVAIDKDDVWGCKEVTVRKNLDKPLKFRCSWIHDQARQLPFLGGIGGSRRLCIPANMSSVLKNFAVERNCCWHNGVCDRCERNIKSQDAAALFGVDTKTNQVKDLIPDVAQDPFVKPDYPTPLKSRSGCPFYFGYFCGGGK